MIRRLFLLGTHLAALDIGFAAGIYALPILTAPPAPDAATIRAATTDVLFTARFERGLKGSDFLHWGEGEIRITRDRVAHQGRLAPGPDYRLYLVPRFVETKEEFLAIKAQSRQIAEVKSFNGFLLDIAPRTDLNAYTTLVVWCESFSQFITAARYR